MNITADGVYHVKTGAGAQGTSLLVSGSLGGGTAKVGYMTPEGVFIPLTDGVLVINEQVEVRHGVGVPIYIELTGSSNPNVGILVGFYN